MVSKASDDLPEPESPVKTTRRPRGISRVTSLRLCSRAPRTTIDVCTSPVATDVPLSTSLAEGVLGMRAERWRHEQVYPGLLSGGRGGGTPPSQPRPQPPSAGGAARVYR